MVIGAGSLVAPFTGAWIEIRRPTRSSRNQSSSHPSRVRGLKFSQELLRLFSRHVSHPSRVRGLKCLRLDVFSRYPHVAPFTGAWIEICVSGTLSQVMLSHPSRVRGLKSKEVSDIDLERVVAPFTGAWIEIR